MNAPIIIETSTCGVYLIIAASVVFIGIGFWGFLKSKTQSRYSPAAIKGLSIFIILFFLICSGYGVYRIAGGAPGLIIDGAGIRDNSSGASGGLIRWENIARLEMSEIQGSRCVKIFVNNSDEVIGRKRGVKKKLMSANYAVYGTPFIISCVALKCDIDELMRVMNERLMIHRRARSSGHPFGN